LTLTPTPRPIKAGHPALARQAKALHAEEKTIGSGDRGRGQKAQSTPQGLTSMPRMAPPARAASSRRGRRRGRPPEARESVQYSLRCMRMRCASRFCRSFPRLPQSRRFSAFSGRRRGRAPGKRRSTQARGWAVPTVVRVRPAMGDGPPRRRQVPSCSVPRLSQARLLSVAVQGPPGRLFTAGNVDPAIYIVLSVYMLYLYELEKKGHVAR
jgi:hypothetical protein